METAMRQEDECKPIQQAAALPIKDGLVCLILSSSGKQWGIPKGHIEADETAEATALREAWEEAGLVGMITREAIGQYRYEKCGRTYEVTVFGMEVAEIAPSWPEDHRRPRRWLSPLPALATMGLPQLRETLRERLIDLAEALQNAEPALCG
jgi:8-oxo-dGTP pyrophosphatase MutT (NUDIX family)